MHGDGLLRCQAVQIRERPDLAAAPRGVHYRRAHLRLVQVNLRRGRRWLPVSPQHHLVAVQQLNQRTMLLTILKWLIDLINLCGMLQRLFEMVFEEICDLYFVRTKIKYVIWFSRLTFLIDAGFPRKWGKRPFENGANAAIFSTLSMKMKNMWPGTKSQAWWGGQWC